LRAAEELGIDLQRSFMVGDKIADIEAGENAGCQPILVLTGYGSAISPGLTKGRAVVCDDLAKAALYILANHSQK